LILTIPANMTARVEVPLRGDRSAVTVDGRRIPFETIAGFAVFENVGSGTHVFRTAPPSRSPVASAVSQSFQMHSQPHSERATPGEEKRRCPASTDESS
jgi:hypothetical protein